MGDSPATRQAAGAPAQTGSGLRGQDVVTTARQLALHSLKHPARNVRHLLSLGNQLRRIALGEMLHRPDPGDVRFADPTWHQHPLYRRVLQAYLAGTQQLRHWVDDSQLSPDDQARARFLAEQLSAALSPSNSPLNPKAVKALFDSAGASMLNGARQLLEDWLHNGGLPRQVDPHAFEVGHNLATTPGRVVFRNEVLELIQYRPMSEYQHERPLLIVPPQVNKFYIFDLSADKSFVQYCLRNDLQTFIVSWRNPDPKHRDWDLAHYINALEQAIEATLAITDSRSLNLLGACAGGLTIAALQGYLQARRQLRKINSATYLVTLLDSQINTPPMLFADEQAFEQAKRRSYLSGVLDGRDMARVFAWMRPNDLIWSYWVNNYLLGRTPPAFDILHWNNDNTRLPAALHGQLLDFFRDNPLARPGGWSIGEHAIDLSKVRLDSYSVAGINDHITPWDAVYCSARLLGGNRQFVLANSGHIQSILNPPGNPKAFYWRAEPLADDAPHWQQQAPRHEGSWWPDWLDWLKARAGARRTVHMSLGNSAYPPLEEAPGHYVHIR